MQKLFFIICLLTIIFQKPLIAKTNLAEWELMKSYLLVVRKNTQLQLQLNHSQYKFSKMVFKEYTKRWWEQYNEAKKDDAIKKYWGIYFSGHSYANQLKEENIKNNYCRFIRAIDVPSITPYKDDIFKEAFERGFKSSTPECYIPNIEQNIIELAKEINRVQKKLLSIKTSIGQYIVNEDELEIIYQEVVEDLKIKEKEKLATYQSELQRISKIPAYLKKRLKTKANQISNLIMCDALVSDLNEYFDCNISFISSTDKLDIIETYHIIKGDYFIDSYMEKIYLSSLKEAINEFLATNLHNEQIVKVHVKRFNQLLKEADKEMKHEKRNILKKLSYMINEQTIELNYKYSRLFNDFFNKKNKKDLLEVFLLLKEEITHYSDFLQSSNYEKNLLKKVKRNYSKALSIYKDISLEPDLPRRDILLELTHNTKSIYINIDSNNIIFKEAFLLGQNRQDNKLWNDILKLTNNNTNK